MPEDYDRDQQRRSDDSSRDLRDGSPASVRRIAEEVGRRMIDEAVPRLAEEVTRRLILQSWNDVGVDFATFQGKADHSRLLDYMRDQYRQRADYAQLMDYVREQYKQRDDRRIRDQEIAEVVAFVREMKAAGKAGKKNLWAIATGIVTAAGGGAVLAWFSKGGGHL